MKSVWPSLLIYYLLSLYYLYVFTFRFEILKPGSLFSESLIVFTPLVSGLHYLYCSVRTLIRKHPFNFPYFNGLAYFLGFLLVYLSAVITAPYEKGYFFNVGVMLILVSTISFSLYGIFRLFGFFRLYLSRIRQIGQPLSLFLMSLFLLFQLAVVGLFLYQNL